MSASLENSAPARPIPARRAVTQHYLMCPPTFFEVTYAINAWMDPSVPVDRGRAMRQWENLVGTYRRLGHRVDVMEAAAGQPDLVFTANAATVVDGVALPARFASAHRRGDEEPYTRWLRKHVRRVVAPTLVNEGEGDLLWTGRLLLAGYGFRTDPAAHGEVAEALGVPLVPLHLVDPHFYHLDTALTLLDEKTIAYYPGAFSPGSRRALQRLYPDAVIAGRADALEFALNSVSDGRNVVVPQQAPVFAAQLRERGFEPVGVDISEFRKSGGGAKCCTLILRD